MTARGKDIYGVFRPVSGKRALPRGPYSEDAAREFGMAGEVHAPDTVRERQQRERAKVYEAAKAELRRVRPTPSSGSQP